LTESLLLDNVEQTITRMHILRSYGICFSWMISNRLLVPDLPQTFAAGTVKNRSVVRSRYSGQS
jgi:hypothetical protein